MAHLFGSIEPGKSRPTCHVNVSDSERQESDLSNTSLEYLGSVSSRRESQDTSSMPHVEVLVPSEYPVTRPSRETSIPASEALTVPPWDRTSEVIWHRRIRSPEQQMVADKLAFAGNRARLVRESQMLASSNDLSTYFKLPDSIRFQICREILAGHDSGKPIRMNSPSYLHPAWPVNPKGAREKIWSADYFDSLEKVLQNIQPYNAVCFAMRMDMMTTLLMTRRFHIVYSPFVTGSLQPAATHFMDKYGPMMKYLTVEVDFTKLGGDHSAHASSYDETTSIARMAKLIRRFVDIQRTRHGTSTVEKLTIMARRYHGLRPRKRCGRHEGLESITELQDSDDGPRSPDRRKEDRENIASVVDTRHSSCRASAEALMWRLAYDYKPEGEELHDRTTPLAEPKSWANESAVSIASYCGDERLAVLDPIRDLGGVVESMCLVGTNKKHATELASHLWGLERPCADEMDQHLYCRVPAQAYPFIPGQTSAIDWGSSRGVEVVRHESDPERWHGPFDCRQIRRLSTASARRGVSPLVSTLPFARARNLPPKTHADSTPGRAIRVRKLGGLVKKASMEFMNRGLSLVTNSEGRAVR